jgi:glutathione synthase
MKFLILTDHADHSDQNSLYALARKLAADGRTRTVFVASRSDGRNAFFFGGDIHQPLHGLVATPGFDFDATGEQFTCSPKTAGFTDFDAVWLRLPPPADPGFFASLTSLAPAAAPIIVNDPRGMLETGSKSFLHHFPDFTAEVRRVQSAEEVQAFATETAIVLKPLGEYGGRGLVRIVNGLVEGDGIETPLYNWLETAKPDIKAGRYLAMKYLKNVSEGDKRILVVNGKIMGASLRVPAPGQWLCNISRGGTSVPAQVSQEEERMIAAIAPVLLDKGVVIFGVDTLMDDDGKRVLSELNTNSIGGFLQAEAQTGRPILQQTINGLYDYLSDRLPRAADRT